MPIQILPTIDVGGRIGQSFGQGLGSALEREATRGRLSKALQGTKENLIDPKTGQMKEGLSGLDVFSNLTTALAGIPGGPEYLQSAFPLIMQDVRRKDPFGSQEGTEKPTPPGVEKIFRDQAMEGMSEEEKKGLQTPQQFEGALIERQTGVNPLTLQSLDQIKAERDMPYVQTADERENMITNIARGLNVSREEAANFNAQHVQQINARRDALLEQQQRNITRENRAIGDLDFAISDRLSDAEQGQIKGIKPKLREIQTQLIQQGKSTRQAATIAAEKAKNYVRAQRNMLDLVSAPSIAEPPKEWMNSVNTTRKAYEEVGALQEFSSELQANLKVGPYTSATMAFPLNKEISREVEKGLDLRTGMPAPFGTSGSHRWAVEKEKRLSNYAEKLKKTIPKYWDENQSLKSLKFDLFSVLGDDKMAYNIINDMINESDIALTDLQQRELSEIQQDIGAPSIGDAAAWYLGQGTQKKGPFERLWKSTIGSKTRR